MTEEHKPAGRTPERLDETHGLKRAFSVVLLVEGTKLLLTQDQFSIVKPLRRSGGR